MPLPPAARRAFWAAIVIAVLLLAEAWSEPLPALFTAALFFLAAWGIRRGRAGAALAGACLLLIPCALAVYRLLRADIGQASPAVLLAGLAVALVAVLLLLRAARELGRGVPVAPQWPWGFVVLLPILAFSMWRTYVIPTQAMADTLQPGDRVLMEAAWWRAGRVPEHGDIVSFRYPADPSQTFLKRIVGVPGDRIAIRDKQLYRNGEPVREPWAVHKTGRLDPYRDNFPGGRPPTNFTRVAEPMLGEHVLGGELVIPEGRYFVLGDNRDNSLDSRYWGFIAREDIRGRAVLIYGSKDWRRMLKRLP